MDKSNLTIVKLFNEFFYLLSQYLGLDYKNNYKKLIGKN